jgi:nitroimidazol reductase NimA-like FMN-containing flavoprotein (pyridoxamine 5'-phosphate oxidase superfamily)
MRRNDREMDREFGLKVIDKSRFGIMSMLDKDEPYGIPLSIVRDEDTLYFHSAMDGRKVKVLGDNPKVSVAITPVKILSALSLHPQKCISPFSILLIILLYEINLLNSSMPIIG